MSRLRSYPDPQLDASLRRIRDALQHNRNQYAEMVEQIMAATGAEVAERVTARIAEEHDRRQQRWQREQQRRQEREERQQDRWQPRTERRQDASDYDPADLPKAFVFAAAALVCVVMAVLRPQLWWLVFVALGLGTSAASAFGRAGRRGEVARDARAEKDGRAEAEEESPTGERARAAANKGEATASYPPEEPADPTVARIQALCDKLLAELESGPPIVREVVTEPEATIGGLRQACLEIARRERELRGVLGAQDEARLLAERDALVSRLSGEPDEIVRDRLGQALRALEQQLAHRAELSTAATRLEAENTRILYTLESLHMQLLRARSTDAGAPELGGRLRESLRELGTEIDAVAEGLELASAPSTAGGTVTAPGPSPAAASTSDAQAAERRAAARRAEHARQAERR